MDILIIRDLLIEGTLRFSDLQNQWMGLVQNIIASTKRIRIARHYNEKSISEVPPRVEYTLTDKGKQLEGFY